MKKGLVREENTLSYLRGSLFVTAVLLLVASLALAGNYAVGTCKPSLPSYSSISSAVSSVPAGSTVEVCPGTYAEQITISQPLTLKGIASGNTSDVVIAVPASGLTSGTDSFGYPVAALLTVGVGPVNISNITVDGTGATVTYPPWLVGILYLDGSSGTIDEVTVRQLNENCCASASVGAWVEGSSGEAITIENSSFHDIDNESVLNLYNVVATIKGNYMGASGYNVAWLGSGSLTGNVIDGGIVGIRIQVSAGTISGNSIVNATAEGILDLGQQGNNVVATSNKISNAPIGIDVFGSGDTYKSNAIKKTGTAIEFNCNLPTVAFNTINDAVIGFDQVPSTFSAADSFNNVGTIRTDGCTSGAAKRVPDLPSRLRVPIQ